MSRVQRYERQVEIPLALVALAFLVAYAWPILDPRLDRSVEDFLTVLSWAIWVVFAADFGLRLYLAEERRRYAVAHWYDLALIALPMLRPLRLLRVLATARVVHRSAVGSLAGRVGVYVFGMTIAATCLGALTVLQAERDAPDANITTAGDALWWATTTVTTVGYGDRYPVTIEGRIVATVLMLVGIALVGAVTAVIAAWLVKSVERPEGNRAKEEG